MVLNVDKFFVCLSKPFKTGLSPNLVSCVIITTLFMTFQNAAGGILGLVGGMLMETVLFIIRSSSKELATSVPRPKKVQ